VHLLALDSSTDWLSVALGDGTSWHERSERAGQAHSARVLRLVDVVCAEVGIRLSELDGIAFGAGPGSFTGVRIACGVAQGLALGIDRPVIAVSTLAALAQEAWRVHRADAVFACIDARMREVYVAGCVRDDDRWTTLEGPAVVRPDDVLLPPGAWHGAGEGFAVYPQLAALARLRRVDASLRPTARAIAELAHPSLVAGEGVAPEHAMPLYVRHRVALTAAERAAGERL
jgi:tRNA threonylcarbamoyladenosine biosynthesis protein TsaB